MYPYPPPLPPPSTSQVIKQKHMERIIKKHTLQKKILRVKLYLIPPSHYRVNTTKQEYISFSIFKHEVNI